MKKRFIRFSLFVAAITALPLMFLPSTQLNARGGEEHRAGGEHHEQEHHQFQNQGEHHQQFQGEGEHHQGEGEHHNAQQLDRNSNVNRNEAARRYGGVGGNGEAVVVPVGEGNYGDNGNNGDNYEQDEGDAAYNQGVQQMEGQQQTPSVNVNINQGDGGGN